MRPLEIARAYIARTWSPVSIKYREKFPPMREWQTLRINHETAPQYFNGGPLNVGGILGKAANGLSTVIAVLAGRPPSPRTPYPGPPRFFAGQGARPGIGRFCSNSPQRPTMR